MRTYDYIILHCSDSSWGDRNIINNWHLQRGWSEIGYHFVVLNGQIKPNFELEALNGSIEIGRDIKKPGAHCLGYNSNSIGICMIGKKHFSKEQIIMTIELITDLMQIYNININNVLGHYETQKANGKTCPNINMDILRDIVKKYQIQDQNWFNDFDKLFSCSI